MATTTCLPESPEARLRAALDAVAAQDRSGWSNAARSAELEVLLAERERLEAIITGVIGAWDAGAAWADDAARTPASWLCRRAPVGRAEAAGLVRSGRLVHTHARTAKALGAGDITSRHVQVAARAARHAEDLFADHEDGILDAAAVTTPDQFRVVMAHWRDLAHDQIGREPAGTRFERRHLHISPVLDGWGHLEGALDADALAAVVQVLDGLEPPDPVDGARPPRTLAQRRADALVRLATGATRPAVSLDVLVDVDLLAGRLPTDLTAMRAEMRGVGPVDRETILRLACDASVGRILMRGRSEVLDVGRRSRLVPPALRRALEARDGGCVEPGCTAPADECDAHHKVHWLDGGETSIHNTELRCRTCHRIQHERDRCHRGRSP